MPLLSTSSLSHSFGADDIFSDITVAINKKERIGLVGANGCGKTTLLKVMAGMTESSAGEVKLVKGLTLGYLRQEAVLTFRGTDNTIYAEMLTVFANLTEMEVEMRELEAKMSEGDMSEGVIGRYSDLQLHFEQGGGYDFANDIKRVLLGLGFDQESWETPLAQLSGGQKTRVLLGRLLLEKPDLLILDEPTNHLDVTAIEWLENTLKRWEGALLIVSHDRYFLDKVVNLIWEMAPQTEAANGITIYKGNYSSFVQQRRDKWEYEQKLFASEKARLDAEFAFIKKHIAGGNHDIAKGKLRRLSRDIAAIEQFGVLAIQQKNWSEIGTRQRTLTPNEADKRLKKLRPTSNRPPKLRVKLVPEERSGRLILRAKNLTIGYEGSPLFTTEKLLIERYDCVGLIGGNGTGKSTFLKTLMGQLTPLRGKLRYGDNIKLGYFAQAHDTLTLTNRVVDEIQQVNGMGLNDARNYLAQYLFRKDDVYKTVGDLSGGERGRLALAILALGGANLLLLDEPTNHLDIPSQEVLQEVLENFEGTIILVSHDRYLVSRLATHIWELQQDQLHVFEGTYEGMMAEKRGEPSPDAKQEPKIEDVIPVPTEAELKTWVEDIVVETADYRADRQALHTRRKELEKLLDAEEAWLDQLGIMLAEARTDGDADRVAQLEDEYAGAIGNYDVLQTEWDELMEVL